MNNLSVTYLKEKLEIRRSAVKLTEIIEYNISGNHLFVI